MTPVPNFMRGPQGVRKLLIPFLQDNMPSMIDLCRTNWGHTPQFLPYPLKYDGNDPFVGQGDYPLVGLYVVGSNNQRATVDYDDAMAQEYNLEYSVRFFCTVVSPTNEIGDLTEDPYGDAVQVRDDILTVMRMCMLAKNSLGNKGKSYLIEETMQEDYPDPMLSKALGARYLAAGIITATVRFTERLQLEPYGHVETAIAEITNVGPDQPFEE